MKEAHSNEWAFLVSETPPSGRYKGTGTGDGKRVLIYYLPSYNSGVMKEDIVGPRYYGEWNSSLGYIQPISSIG